MSRATMATLEELHNLTGEVLAIMLKAAAEDRLVEFRDGEYVRVQLPPAMLGQALKFLSDNSVNQPAPDKGEDRLKDEMPSFDGDTVVPFRKTDGNHD